MLWKPIRSPHIIHLGKLICTLLFRAYNSVWKVLLLQRATLIRLIHATLPDLYSGHDKKHTKSYTNISLCCETFLFGLSQNYFFPRIFWNLCKFVSKSLFLEICNNFITQRFCNKFVSDSQSPRNSKWICWSKKNYFAYVSVPRIRIW